MATKHRRIDVTCDPELAAALEDTRELLGDVPTRREFARSPSKVPLAAADAAGLTCVSPR